jgi:CheY-like chemotaxis protein
VLSLRSACCLLLGAGLLLLIGLSPTAAQDKEKDKAKAGEEYRRLYKAPKTVPEAYAAMQFEIELGRYGLAALYIRALTQMLDALDDEKRDAVLVELWEQEGINTFLKLTLMPQWRRFALQQMDPNDRKSIDPPLPNPFPRVLLRDTQAQRDADLLLARVTAAVDRQLGDQTRILRYLDNLVHLPGTDRPTTPELHDYALQQLYRSGVRAMPYFIRVLQTNSSERHIYIDALSRMSPDTVPALIAALDSGDSLLQRDVLTILQRRRAVEAIPFLWYLAGNPETPALIRKQAVVTIATFLSPDAVTKRWWGRPAVDTTQLLSPKIALTREAEKYYLHRVQFADPKRVKVWRWDDERKTVMIGWRDGETVIETIDLNQAEEYYGLYFARRALAIDPTYLPAQVLYLSILLDKAFEREGTLARTPDSVRELLARVGPDVLLATAERALDEKRTSVVLGTVRTLGDLAEQRAGPLGSRQEPVLARALVYPDRRVQFAAAEAFLHVPTRPTNQTAGRIVDVLRREVAIRPPAPAGRVLVGYFDKNLAARIVADLKAIGFDAVAVNMATEVLPTLQQSADFDLVLIDSELPGLAQGLPELLERLRVDRYASRLPVIVTADGAREDAARLQARRHPNVTVVTNAILRDQRDLKTFVGNRIAVTSQLGADEAAAYQERAVVALARMAVGDLAGYDVRPALPTVTEALRSARLSEKGQEAAIRILGRQPGRDPQFELYNVVIAKDDKYKVPVKVAAADELLRHIQKHQLQLVVPDQTAPLQQMAKDLKHWYLPRTELRDRIERLVGILPADARAAGERLLKYDFRPPTSPPPKP